MPFGEVPEWFNGAAPKAVVPSGDRGFESLPLRPTRCRWIAACFFAFVCITPTPEGDTLCPPLIGVDQSRTSDNGVFGGKNYWGYDGQHLGSTYWDQDRQQFIFESPAVYRLKTHRNPDGSYR